ncbi:octopamine receptor beta-2R-like [Exaiptasia diaphana]|uniref:G-protein coupled receptors family 1 profile domain-containing protein n=1 Tax=Exaiptasia diaphana TaxID=2652724 RepID=A0A913WX47_EXADI|nr:octopamine receptor beta-2R-like [Exaiptasia diaphana]
MITWYWVIRGIASFTATVGNTLVMILILRCRRLRVSIPNWYIFALALADMMVGAILTPCEFICTYWYSCDPYILRLTFDIIVHFSVTSLCAMTFERFMVIARPLQYRDFMTKKRVLLILFSSWSFGAIFPITGYICMAQQKPVADKTLRIMNTIFLQILPPIMLMLVFISMVYIANKHEKKERTQRNQLNYNYAGEEHKDRSRHIRDKASVKMMGVVIITFAICYMLAMFRSLYFYIMNRNIPITVTYISRIMILVNSTVNFIVYAFLKKDFRQEIGRIFKAFISR